MVLLKNGKLQMLLQNKENELIVVKIGFQEYLCLVK